MATNDIITFEDFKNENGIIFWWASDLMHMLGYDNMNSFDKVIQKATKAMMTLGIDCYENIIPKDKDGQKDYKLTRFACYMVAMNGDSKKEAVAEVQRYFAVQTRKFEVLTQNPEQMERLLIREELKSGYQSMSRTAKEHGVVEFDKFQNAGYLGLYNMINVDLAKVRNIDKTALMDHMGRTELAANLFRMTQTEERIKVRDIQGQKKLEEAHYEVGREVRDMVQKNTGKSPESLPVEKPITEVKKALKDSHKEIKKMDYKPVVKVKKKKDTDGVK